MRFRSESALLFLTALALAAAVAPPCHAQRDSRVARAPRPDPNAQRELQQTMERERLYNRMQERMRRGPVSQPPRTLALAQISEDFTRIQIVNNALAKAVAAGGQLDFKLVAQSASEIKKRAGRLRDNLLLPESYETGRRASFRVEPAQLKAALGELDRLVLSFVSNPGFQSVRVVDAQWSAQARSDLEGIIELSGRVKTCGEQLHKASRKSP